MSIYTRFLNRLRPDRLERHLRDEVEFHIDMRTEQHLNAGLSREDAMKRAREQFGDVKAAITGMRRARLSSTSALLTTVSLVAMLLVIWSARGSRSDDQDIPGLPPAPQLLHLHSLDAPGRTPPPPPPPPPTREQCLEQAKTVPRICQ
jgi:hypothetical protein